LLRALRGHGRSNQGEACRCILFDLAATAIMTIPQETGGAEVSLLRVCQCRLERVPIMVRHRVDGHMREEIRRRYARGGLVWALRILGIRFHHLPPRALPTLGSIAGIRIGGMLHTIAGDLSRVFKAYRRGRRGPCPALTLLRQHPCEQVIAGKCHGLRVGKLPGQRVQGGHRLR
jgi:hypothetical protein